jgi:hypothetical protein
VTHALLLLLATQAPPVVDTPGLGKAVDNISAGGNGSVVTLLGSLLVVVGTAAVGLFWLYAKARESHLAEKDARLADEKARAAERLSEERARAADARAADARYTEFAIKASDALARAAEEMRMRRGG